MLKPFIRQLRVLPLVAGVGLLCYVAAHRGPASPVGPPPVREELDVVYGTGGGEHLTLDLFVPENQRGPMPAVVVLHGGGWEQGSKEDMHGAARWLAGHGYVTAAVGYRFAPRHRFPAQIEDVKCAVRWLRANADKYHLDPDRLGALGFSAGGHLALLLGLTDPDDELEGEGGWPEHSSKVRAVVNVYGPTDLTQPGWTPALENVFVDLLGGNREQQLQAYRLASPATYVRRGAPPVLTIHGTTDAIVPYEQAERLDAALRACGAYSRLETLDGTGHGGTWVSRDFDRFEAATLPFLDEHVKKN